MKKIIDLSKYNTVTDWNKVKVNCDGVILRVGYRGYGSGRIVIDAKFQEFAEKCHDLGIPFGLYFVSQAITEKEGREEAAFTVSYASQYGATLGLYFDSEDGDGTSRKVRADGLSRTVRTAIAKAFCDTVNESGYVGGVYASESWFGYNLYYEQLTKYLIWVAKYGKNNGSKTSTVNLTKCDMHQFTSKASIPGIKGACDLSECYLEDIVANVPVSAAPEVRHVQPDYKPGVVYYVHATDLAVRSKPGTDGKVLYRLSNTAVLNKATTRDEKGNIWMNVSGTDTPEWCCADNGTKSYIY